MNIQHSRPLSSPSTPPPVCSDLQLSLMFWAPGALCSHPLPSAWDAGTLHSRAGWRAGQIRDADRRSWPLFPKSRAELSSEVAGLGEPSQVTATPCCGADLKQIPAGAGGGSIGAAIEVQVALWSYAVFQIWSSVLFPFLCPCFSKSCLTQLLATFPSSAAS